MLVRRETVMLRSIVSVLLLCTVAAGLGGCGYSDAYATYVPEALRYKTTEIRPEVIPDVKAMLRENPQQVFSTRTPPQNMQVSVPRRNANGPGWTSCVRANIAGITGRSIGTQTYLLSIDHGKIGDRRLATADSPCTSESYEPV